MRHFQSIHYLRAAAATMVVVFHIFSNVPFMHSGLQHAFWLRGGVDLFFVISGFVMVQSTIGRKITPAQFIGQRALRIIPMYWVATFAVMMQIEGEWLFKLKSMLFIPAVNPESGMMQPVLEPGWTLNYEMFFYAVFAVSLFLKESLRLPAIACMFALLVFVGGIAENSQSVEFYTRPLVIEFVLGMAIARYRFRVPVIAVPIAMAVMFLLQSEGVDRLYSLGLPAALIVAGALSYEDRVPQWRWADFLGSASYSIYLFHLLALGFLVKIWPDAETNKSMFAMLSFGLMMLTGCGVYWALERPMMMILKGFRAKSTNVPGPRPDPLTAQS